MKELKLDQFRGELCCRKSTTNAFNATFNPERLCLGGSEQLIATLDLLTCILALSNISHRM